METTKYKIHLKGGKTDLFNMEPSKLQSRLRDEYKFLMVYNSQHQITSVYKKSQIIAIEKQY